MEIMSYNVACNALAVKIMRYNTSLFYFLYCFKFLQPNLIYSLDIVSAFFLPPVLLLKWRTIGGFLYLLNSMMQLYGNLFMASKWGESSLLVAFLIRHFWSSAI